MLPSKMDVTHPDSQSLVSGAQDMVREASSAAIDKADALLAQVSSTLKTTADKAMDLQKAAIQNSKKITASTNEYVRDNPWKAVGIAAVAAALISAVIARR